MIIPIDAQTLITKTLISNRLGPLINYPGYSWIINNTNYLPTNSPLLHRIWHINNNIHIIPICPVCNQKTLNWSRRLNQYKQVCSVQCATKTPTSNEKRKLTNLEKYGHENPSMNEQVKDKRTQTFVDNFGTTNPFKSADIKEKIRQQMIENYGVEHALQNSGILEKMRQHVLEKYGVESTNQLEDIKQKKKDTCMENYGVEYPLQSPSIQQNKQLTDQLLYDDHHYNQRHLTIEQIALLKNNDWLYHQHYTNKKTLTEIAVEIGCSETIISTRFKTNNWKVLYFFTSGPEKELQQLLTDYQINFQSNVRTIIAPHELDIYIPDYNLAIEYCGLYWHSSKFKSGAHYHSVKQKVCQSKGIRLITIFEDEWIYNKELVTGKLLSILGKDTTPKVFARKCKIIQVSSKTKSTFFDQNHIQGNGPGSINIGLEYNNELVACMSFIKQPNGVMNLNRYATKYQVIGGFSKLLKHFQKTYEWNQILSFADLRWSQGNLYTINGFKLDKILPPDYEYVDSKNNKRIHKFNFRHKNLPNILGSLYNPTWSETRNTLNANWYKIYNCGLMRYILNNE